MNVPNVGQILLASLNGALVAVTVFVPKFLAGLVILLIGIIIASIVRQLIVSLLVTLHVEKYLRRYGVPEGKKEFTWTNILGEIARWFIIIIFLIPTAQVWGLSQIDVILQHFLDYLPNVFISVVIGLVGFVFAKLAHDVVLASTRGLSKDTAKTLAIATQYAITIFTILAVLTQLNVAADLVKILFQGFVAMVAVAGGIAFGLGGQGVARDILESLRKNITSEVQEKGGTAQALTESRREVKRPSKKTK